MLCAIVLAAISIFEIIFCIKEFIVGDYAAISIAAMLAIPEMLKYVIYKIFSKGLTHEEEIEVKKTIEMQEQLRRYYYLTEGHSNFYTLSDHDKKDGGNIK